MSPSRRQRERNCKRRIARRLRRRNWCEQPEPMFRAQNIHYEISARTRALGPGGLGAMHLVARRTGLIEEIDADLHLLKRHLPYHESDHVLHIAYNFLSGGDRLEDLELWRNDENYLNALGAQRIPDPTTAGDFCRRFETEEKIETLMATINEARLRVWGRQPAEFFEEAILDADGTQVPTTGECKAGMEISHKGLWGYSVLVVSLANTQEPLYLENHSGNRPSHEGAAHRLDQSIALCRRAGFRRICLRGDTDFSQTTHLDRWDGEGVQFIFGMDAAANLCRMAESLSRRAWERLVRPPRYAIQTEPRARPENVRERVVREREFENIRLRSEEVAEFPYRPRACKKAYRMVVVRKNLSVEKGEWALFDQVRYFFYITNDGELTAEEVVWRANQRCHQENLVAQLKNGVRALHAPVNSLLSNWAYMVMASLAWSLKAWFALLLPEGGRWAQRREVEKETVLRMEFKSFINAFIRVPCQIVRVGRRIVYRLLAWTRWQAVFLRGVEALRYPLRC